MHSIAIVEMANEPQSANELHYHNLSMIWIGQLLPQTATLVLKLNLDKILCWLCSGVFTKAACSTTILVNERSQVGPWVCFETLLPGCVWRICEILTRAS